MSTPPRKRVGIVGAGRIAEEHLEYLHRSSTTEVVAVCDRDELLAQRAVRNTQARAYGDLGELLSNTRLDSLHVLTPAAHHPIAVHQAVQAAVPLIIVEKPAAPDYRATRAMLDEVAASGSQISEDHNYRFNQPVQELLGTLARGELGLMRTAEVRMTMPLANTRYDAMSRTKAQDSRTRIMREFLPHLSYLGLLLLPGGVLSSVQWCKRDTATHVRPDDLAAELMSTDGTQTCRIVFSSGVAPHTTSVTVHGSLGWARADLQNPHLFVSRERAVGPQLSPLADQAANGVALLRSGFRGIAAKLRGSPIYSGIPVYLEQTYDAFASGAELPVSGAQMLEAALLTDELANGGS